MPRPELSARGYRVLAKIHMANGLDVLRIGLQLRPCPVIVGWWNADDARAAFRFPVSRITHLITQHLKEAQ